MVQTATTPFLILLCGRSFAGKTTLAAYLREQIGCAVVSLDEINARRGLCSGSGLPIEEWQRTHRIATAETRRALRRGGCVIVDDTSSMRFLRDRWRSVASEEMARFQLVVVTVDPEGADRRRESALRARSRPGVNDRVLSTHLASFEDPTPDENPLTVRSDQDPSNWIGLLDLG